MGNENPSTLKRNTGHRVTAATQLSSIRDHPCGVLLGAQLVTVLVYPFFNDSATGRSIVGVVQMLVVLLAVLAVRRTPGLTWVAAVVGLPAAVLTICEAIAPDHDAIVLASAGFHVPFYFFVSFALIRYVFNDEHVTRDELFAVGAAFTVFAWGFAYLYAATQVLWPGSFVGLNGDEHPWFDLLFLSFTTLTSVGLSDIVPALDHARSLVMVEQVAGVLYVALVIARLVGLSAARHRPPPE